jgi:predicted Rossmann fold flavoprotein
MKNRFDTVIIGGGAAGLMCALTLGTAGKTVLVLEKAKKPGAKILISGGGRCNFTNQDAGPSNYISENPHFAKSALARYTPWDFMGLLAAHGVTWHEKKLGQLFCDQGAKRILSVLLDECEKGGVKIDCDAQVNNVERDTSGLYHVSYNETVVTADCLVMASGGPSIPKMGATGFGYDLARNFGLKIIEPKPALVPFTFADDDLAFMKPLAGVSADSVVSNERKTFRENILFTHRGLSGPAILQISSYWNKGEAISINLLPDISDTAGWLLEMKKAKPKSQLKTILGDQLSSRLADALMVDESRPLGEMANGRLAAIADKLSKWHLTPTGTEGLAKAEVTRGGVSTDELSSKTMECKSVPGLYFIGECVDVTGWLGGYNFQWAWASGWAAAQAIAANKNH